MKLDTAPKSINRVSDSVRKQVDAAKRAGGQ